MAYIPYILDTLSDASVHSLMPIRQNQCLFKTGHSPLISKLVQHINTQTHTFTYYCNVSFSVLRCFRSMSLFAPIGEIAHERMHVLSIISYKTKERHQTRHMSRPVFSCCAHISSNSFQFCHFYHQ